MLINDEPVFYRAYRNVYPDLPPFRIRKVGIIANWEFGNDTGSRFERFWHGHDMRGLPRILLPICAARTAARVRGSWSYPARRKVEDGLLACDC